MVYIGVDVGGNGGMAALDTQGAVIGVLKIPDTEIAIYQQLTDWAALGYARAVVERVWSSPQMGVASAFSFGRAYGTCRMALAAAAIPFDDVTPQRWQRRLGCLSGRDKNVTKVRAQQLFPTVKVTHATADALLLAEYCRQVNAS